MSAKILPMNKLLEDVTEFEKERERESFAVVKTDETLENEVVLFAHDMSKKYETHVDVTLVKTLIRAYQDSINDQLDDEKNWFSDLFDNIDDDVDLNDGD
jgi:hypothetical protein